jgi:hypothetical protein
MKAILISIIFSSLFNLSLIAQNTGIGLGIYSTGTEVGVGFRSGKNSTWLLDARVTKANFFNNPAASSFISEISGVCRVIKLEKVRLHIGLGLRNEWNFGKNNRIGAVVPIGVEAFPFSFQNAGLFFEVAPFFTDNMHKDYYAGLRTVAGFVFYFPTKEKPAVNK